MVLDSLYLAHFPLPVPIGGGCIGEVQSRQLWRRPMEPGRPESNKDRESSDRLTCGSENGALSNAATLGGNGKKNVHHLDPRDHGFDSSMLCLVMRVALSSVLLNALVKRNVVKPTKPCMTLVWEILEVSVMICSIMQAYTYLNG
ncbi:hypothetical protein PoB_007689500 [Plakobranchus ocellatus]|uniref:Uncharacterized protein n=1 Tax=Plakobranchus ocellatus TaxID=259542 RepID=A0AAV4E275_9GAST|nr:hypothetical protein PoB_007689500 [Plakobranchus ocellatus]